MKRCYGPFPLLNVEPFISSLGLSLINQAGHAELRERYLTTPALQKWTTAKGETICVAKVNGKMAEHASAPSMNILIETDVPNTSAIVAPEKSVFIPNDVHTKLNHTILAQVFAPKTISDIQHVIKQAVLDKQHVSISGGRHCMGG